MAAGSAARRRREGPVGAWTRAQLEADLGLTGDQLDTFERAGVLAPTSRRQPGDTRPVLYDEISIGFARAAMAAHRLGVRGQRLRWVAEQLATKRRRLTPGWSGWAVIELTGDVELVPAGGDLAATFSVWGSGASALVVWFDVPILDESAVA